MVTAPTAEPAATDRPLDLVTLGEPLIALTASGQRLTSAGTLTVSVAGAEANVAIGLARLGRRTALLGLVGPDPFGERIRRTLRAEGVDTSGLLTGTLPTGLLAKQVLGPDEVDVHYHRQHSASTQLTADSIDPRLVARARRVHLSGVTLALGPGPAAAAGVLVETAHALGVPVSFDPNLRRRLWSAETAAIAYRRLLPYVSDLLLSQEEAQVLTGEDQVEAAAGQLLDQLDPTAAARVVVRLGADGSVGAQRSGRQTPVSWCRQPAHPVRAVDTVGAGDAFNAGYLYELLRGNDLPTALRTGSLTAARVVACLGDHEGFPYRAELPTDESQEVVRR